ncbi:MAG: type II secretion system F family protein [Halomonadaceae bacterium]|nr:MAG: type II secretion system F family protein [Halomonadaceae bacterium]
MLFAYRGRDGEGALAEGTLEASSSDAAASELQRRGITPLTVTEKAAGSSSKDLFKDIEWLQAKVSVDDLIVFCRQMYALTKAGIPIIRTIRGLADSARSPRLGEVLDDLADRLESGATLATAMQAHNKVFPDIFVAMIHVGENTGELDKSFKRLAQILELERDTKRRIKQAMRYPTFVIIALSAAMVIINIFVIPQFASTFERLGADLPFLTRVLVFTSNTMMTYWPLMLLLLAGGIYGFRAWSKSPAGRVTWDRYKLKMPVLGPLLHQITLSRFSRNFASTLSAGVPVTQAMTVVANASDNAWVGKHLHEMRNGIERGESLLRTARNSKMFTPLVLQMIGVGEETGGVDEMLVNVADFYDEEVDYGLSRLAESIEPILLLGVAFLVLILALGVFLPIWDLGSAAMG